LANRHSERRGFSTIGPPSPQNWSVPLVEVPQRAGEEDSSRMLGAFGAMLPDPLQTIHAHFPREPLRTLQRFHDWIHTDREIKKDIILGVGSQITLVAVMVGLTMVAHYGVLDQALAK
jgi:hypothetical protein